MTLNTAPSPDLSDNAPSPHLSDAIVASLEDAKAEGVLSINLIGKTTLADYMVIASGRSTTHVGAIAERVIKTCKEHGVAAPRVEGVPNNDWALVDAGNVIVHIFRPEVRQFYNLEKMWSGDRPADGRMPTDPSTEQKLAP